MLKPVLKAIGLVISLSGLTQAAIAADDKERAVLVLDASGSMWGQVDNTSKIAVARDVIRKLVSDWNPKVQLGLTAYGHREKGNCADIETLVPVGNVNAGTIMAAVKDLQPKGKTPLSDAVRQAARDLKYTEERATVILVSDGKETCNADPCAVAAELEKNGVDFTVHVVGFDLTEEEKAQLRCVADKTGGKFLSAKNASELHKAMTTTVQLVAEPKPAKKRVVKLKTGLTGTIMVKGVTGRHTFIYAPGKTYKESLAQFNPSTRTPVQLVPGTYVVGKRNQELTRIELAAGKDVVVDLKDVTGTIMVKGVTGPHAFVYAPGKTYKQSLAQFNPSTRTPAQLVPGTYVIGKRNQDLGTVELKAGEELVFDMADVMGSILIKGLKGRHAYVYAPGKTHKQSLARFNPSTTTPAQLVPGTYVIGKHNQELTRVEVTAGKDVVVDMADVTGSILLKGVKGSKVYVYAPGKTYKESLASFFPSTTEPAQLIPGTYSIGSRKQEFGTVELKAGEELVVDLGD